MMVERQELMSPNLARALRWAAYCHRGQERKGSGVPYVEHVLGVALILDRAGFAEDVVIAGLLHDVVEDTEATLEQVEAQFGSEVARIVGDCSEEKNDSQGNKRPWIDRKRDHLAAMGRFAGLGQAAPVALADKLHNLMSIELDLRDGRPIWSHFNAEREMVLWYQRTMIDQIGRDDPRLERLASQCRSVLAAVEALGIGSDEEGAGKQPGP